MAQQIILEASRTYSTAERAVKAAQDRFGHIESLRFFIQTDTTGRFFPVFIGEKAVVHMVHLYFPIVA